MNLLLGLLALVTGALMPVQVGINAALRQSLGAPLLAGLANFVVGAVALAVLAVVLRVPFPAGGALTAAPVWHWMGGLIGACVVVVSLMAGPRLGAGVLFTLIVAGQILASMLLDHFALVGYAERALNPARMLGAALLVSGVVLIVRN
jgi:transporter family-2 protein